MPKIPDWIPKSIVFIETENSESEPKKGTGFIINCSTSHLGENYHFVVTCKHGIEDSNTSISLNLLSEGIFSAKRTPKQWYFNDIHDIAITRICEHELTGVNYEAINIDCFISDDYPGKHSVTLGEHVFMVGRFLGHEHDREKDNKLPSFRFGCISIILSQVSKPGEPLKEVYHIDMATMPGYSGSPMFVFNKNNHSSTIRNTHSNKGDLEIGLLGINCAATNLCDEACMHREVSSHTAIVLPAENILEVLEEDISKSKKTK